MFELLFNYFSCSIWYNLVGLVQSSVIYLVLKYVVDWVDGQVAFLEAKDTAILFSFCVRLLEIYSAHNIGKVSVTASVNLLSESQTEKYKDLRALLQLLTNLSSKDLVSGWHGHTLFLFFVIQSCFYACIFLLLSSFINSSCIWF